MEQFFLRPEALPFLELRTTWGSTLAYDAHMHTQFSIGIILEGDTLFYLDGTARQARYGDIVLIAPMQVHRCNPVNGAPRSYHMFFFDAPWFEEQVATPLLGGSALCLANPLVSDAGLFAWGLDVAKEIEKEDASSLVAWLSAVLVQAGAKPVSEIPPGKNARASLGESFPSLRHLPLRSNPLIPGAEDMTLPGISSLAARARMRRESYSRLVRRSTGLPPRSWLHCLRIEKGRLLLRQGKSISEAALESGYADQSHFHRMFRRIVCATPGSYRKKRSQSYKK